MGVHRIIRKDGKSQRYHFKESNFRKFYSKIKRGVYSKANVFKEAGKVNLNKIESKIRQALFHGVSGFSRTLADRVPIGYDRNQKLWVINDYVPKGNNARKVPIEIHVEYNYNDDLFSVKEYAVRGSDDSGDFESALNG